MDDVNSRRILIFAAVLGGLFLLLYAGLNWQIEKRHAERAEAYEEACAQGSKEDCFDIANVTMRGRGVTQDLERARELFRKSCDMGYIAACNDLGWSFENPLEDGFSPEYDRAAKYYEEACDGGDMMACGNLAKLYYLGQGVTKDLDRTVELSKLACEENDAHGCHGMGALYMEGAGELSEDTLKAGEYFEKACELDPEFC